MAQITSLELAAIVNEIPLGRIDNIYRDEKVFLFQLYTQQGKKYLYIKLGETIFLSDIKIKFEYERSEMLTQFRRLKNERINKVYQLQSERILVFETVNYKIIAEFFGKGNLYLLKNDGTILNAARTQKRGGAKLVTGKQYDLPPEQFNWKEANEQELLAKLNKSGKDKLVTALAGLGLGGLYAEEVCARAGVDKEIKPSETSKDVWKALQTMKKLIEKPAGVKYDDAVTPFALVTKGEPEKKYKTYSEALAEHYLSRFERRDETEEKTTRVLEQQEKDIEALQQEKKEAEEKAEAIYKNYAQIQEILLYAQNELEKGTNWDKIKTQLLAKEEVLEIDLKNKKIKIKEKT